ncbi:MAG: S41 family peptidase, partial [Parachlamydiaceae bacterium]
ECEYQLNWAKIHLDTLLPYVQLAAYGPCPGFSIHEFEDDSIWISIPTFVSRRKEVKECLEEIVRQLPALRSKKRVVFDLRGNKGGDSKWVIKILFAFYGKEYLSSLPHVKNENALADDRVSLEAIRHLEKLLIEEGALTNSQTSENQDLTNYYKKIKAAYERGDLLLRRPTDVHVFSEIKQPGLNIQNPASGKVYLLTDGRCFSSGLIFADSILSIPGVVHIGTTTNADTQFSQPIPIQLPSGKSSLYVPTMIRRNWERKDNEPYCPLHLFPGYMGDSKELEEWVLTLD